MAGGLPQNCVMPGTRLPRPYRVPRHRYYRIPYRIPRRGMAVVRVKRAWPGVGRGQVTAGVSTTGRSRSGRGSGGFSPLQEVTEEWEKGLGGGAVEGPAWQQEEGTGSGLASEGTWSHSSRNAPPLQVEAGLPPGALRDLTCLSSQPR